MKQTQTWKQEEILMRFSKHDKRAFDKDRQDNVFI